LKLKKNDPHKELGVKFEVEEEEEEEPVPHKGS